MRQLLTLLSIGALVLSGCGSEQCSWPKAPAGATGKIVRVSSVCGVSTGADGSEGAPYATLALAIPGLSAAGAGGVVLLDNSPHEVGNAKLPGGVQLIGTGRGSSILQIKEGQLGLLIQGTAVAAANPPRTRLEGFSVVGGGGVGVAVVNSALDVRDVEISGTKATSTGDGRCLSVADAADITVFASRFADCEGAGIALERVSRAVVGNPTVDVDPRTGRQPGQVARAGFEADVHVVGNGGGGISILDPSFRPTGKTDDAMGSGLLLNAAEVTGNSIFGVALFGADATISRSVVGASKVAPGATAQGGSADGIVVAEGNHAGQSGTVTIGPSCVVGGNARAGVLVATSTRVNVAGEIADNKNGGVWAQGGGSVLRLGSEARVCDNAMVGAVAVDGAQLVVDGATIERTTSKEVLPQGAGLPFKMGDGIGVYNGAQAAVIGATFRGNARAHVVAIDPAEDATSKTAAVAIANNKFEGGKFGVAIKTKTAASGAELAKKAESANDFDDKVEKTVDEDTSVKVSSSPCNGKDPADCAPKKAIPVDECNDQVPCPDLSGGCLKQECKKADAGHMQCVPVEFVCKCLPDQPDTQCDDGEVCTADSCSKDGECVYAPAVIACADGTPCVTWSCEDSKCVSKPLAKGTSCDDGNKCTLNDTCSGTGTCSPGTTYAVCDDGVECTFDYCDGVKHCQYAATASCK